MNFDKYTDRSRGFVQSAQSLAHARGTSAICARAPAQGAARRSGRARRGPDRPLRRQFARRLWPPSRRRWPSAPRFPAAAPGRSISTRRWRACSRPPRRRARRPATASSPSSGCCSRSRWRRTARPARSSPMPASRRKTSMPRSKRCARAAPPTRRRPKTPMTR